MMPMMMVSIMRADISGGYEYEYHSKENKIATHRMAILFSLCTV